MIDIQKPFIQNNRYSLSFIFDGDSVRLHPIEKAVESKYDFDWCDFYEEIKKEFGSYNHDFKTTGNALKFGLKIFKQITNKQNGNK